MTFYTNFQSSIGNMILVSDGQALTGLYFADQKNVPFFNLKGNKKTDLEIFLNTQSQILEYLSGMRKKFDVNYGFECGTAFQRMVWDAVLNVAYGQTVSYKNLAESVGYSKGIRAVASAVGKNPLMLIVPCHRIIGNNGALTGYAGGLERKGYLLSLERQQ